MKSQDVLVAVKLVTLHIRYRQQYGRGETLLLPDAWQGWLEDSHNGQELEAQKETISAEGPKWTYAELSRSIGISASECNVAVHRGISARLLRHARDGGQPLPVRASIKEFLMHGFKYVFPPAYGSIQRGIPTAGDAPVLSGQLVGASNEPAVWPDSQGVAKGISLKPIHQSVTFAVRRDPILYEVLALLDSVRSGRPREADLAGGLLESRLDQLR